MNLDLYLRNLLMSLLENVMNSNEREDYRKFLNEVFLIFLNEVFLMKDYGEEAKTDCDNPIINEVIAKVLSSMKINNKNFEKQIKFLYTSLLDYNSFILVGPLCPVNHF